MKIFYLKFILIGFLLSSFAISLMAQRSNGIAVEGKITVQQGVVEGAVIQMFIDGRRMDNYGVGADGHYKVELNYNHKYELIFTLKGNFSQKIMVESSVPKEVLQTDPRFPPFPLNINLFTEIPGIDKSFVDNTILKIYYSQNVDNFISELYYNDAQIAKLIEQAKLQGQQIGKVSDYLSKLTRAELAELRKEYNKLLSQAGKQYSGEQFLAALDGYKAASKIFPNEQFPKDRIAEINDLLGLMMVAAELDKALAERFDQLIKEADQLFNQKNYADAQNSYNRALSIKPNDNYANQQVKLINDLLKKQMADEQYNIVIAQADNSFKQLLYNEAANSYQEALGIKPNEAYPKSKLEEIKGILARQSQDAEKLESYKQAMQQAEIMFQKQFYEKSLASFENALNLKPGDEPASRKIEEVKGIMNRLAAKLMYDKLIVSADKSLKKDLLKEALTDYVAAAAIIPDDKYAAQRIEEINQKLKFSESYTELIAKADNQFNAKNYSDAKSLYTEAAVVKPNEKYPKDKVLEINAILSQIAKTNQGYRQAVAKADGLFQQKSYEKAKEAFAEAGRIKPEETYPPEMIGKIDVLIAEQTRLAAEAEAERIRLAEGAAAAEAARLAAIQAEKDKSYTEAITKADNLFNEKQYENARNEYRAAQIVKPAETYPKQRIDEIGKTLAALEQVKKEKELLDKNYANAIQQADRFFTGKSYDQSKGKYSEALVLKPEEAYPKERIAEIEKILQQQILDEKYRVIIVAADGFYKTENYSQAKAEYEKALTVKAGEPYPKNQIAKIDGTLQKEQQKILADKNAAEDLQRRSDEIAELNRVLESRGVASDAELKNIYDQYIKQADELFDARLYIVSRSWYYKGWDVKPDERYPKQRIDEINRLLNGLLSSQLDRDYQKFVDLADSTFRNNQYAVSRGWYNRALGVKANEKYPKDQIKEIETKIAERMAGQSGQQFEADVQKAVAAFDAKNYNVARFWYKRALELRPENADVKTRLKEIDAALKK